MEIANAYIFEEFCCKCGKKSEAADSLLSEPPGKPHTHTHTRIYTYTHTYVLCKTGGLDGKKSTCDAGDLGSIPELGRSPGEGNDNPLQYSCLENFMDR